MLTPQIRSAISRSTFASKDHTNKRCDALQTQLEALRADLDSWKATRDAIHVKAPSPNLDAAGLQVSIRDLDETIRSILTSHETQTTELQTVVDRMDKVLSDLCDRTTALELQMQALAGPTTPKPAPSKPKRSHKKKAPAAPPEPTAPQAPPRSTEDRFE